MQVSEFQSLSQRWLCNLMDDDIINEFLQIWSSSSLLRLGLIACASIMAPFSKPEAVLKQAEGLVSVGQTHAALQSLTEMFSSKRFRSTPLIALEPIMFRFIELCVELRKGRTAKEGLMQYKNIAQNTSVASIEKVILRFVQLADAKVKEAQEKAKAVTVAVDVDDLEAS